MRAALPFLILFVAFLLPRHSRAAGEETSSEATAATTAEERSENKRLRTLEGSLSRFSGQLDLTYYGSTMDHPFAEDVPNPGRLSVPPVVTLSGTGSLRYRIDYRTTVGIGTGITTQTPFQGPTGTTLANPYADVARSYHWGPVKSRADLKGRLWTDARLHRAYGQSTGLSLVDEAYYVLSFGLTTGLSVTADYNTFVDSPTYDTAKVRSGQVMYDFHADPYFEYPLGRKTNLRTVIGARWDHTRSLSAPLDFYSPLVYQTLGVGIAFTRAEFLYVYARAYPYSGGLALSSTTFGFNAIVNLF